VELKWILIILIFLIKKIDFILISPCTFAEIIAKRSNFT